MTTSTQQLPDEVFIEGKGFKKREDLLKSWGQLTDGEREMFSEAFQQEVDAEGKAHMTIFDFAATPHGREVFKEIVGSMSEPEEDQGATDDAFGIQVGGSHYRECQIQPGQYILANGLGFFEGCMIKRLTRYNRATGKGLEDLKKVRHEIDILIQDCEQNGIRKPQSRS